VRRPVRIVLALAIGLVLLVLALYGVDVGRVRELMRGVRPLWLVAAGVIYLSAYFVRSLRWRLILRPVHRLAVSESFFMLMAGYFLNYVIPIRAGEVAKSFFLKKLKGVPIATSLPTVFLDKLMELVSIVLVVLMLPILSVSLSGALATLIYTVLAIFGLAIGLLVLAIRNERLAARILSGAFAWLPSRVSSRLSDWFELFVRGLGVVRHNVKAIWPLLGMTGLAVLLDAVYFWTMFWAFSIRVPFPMVLFGYTLLSLSYILPTPPAQIGYNEFVIGLIFAAGLGLVRDEVSAVMILAHVLTGLIITAVGFWSFGAMSIRVGESFRRISGSGGREAAPSPAGTGSRRADAP